MAGKGPAASGQRQRARDEKASAPWDVLPAEGYTGEFPPLPSSWQCEVTRWERDEETREKYPVTEMVDREYLDRTRHWYETFARSPMAVRFTTVDWVRLEDLARLKDCFYRGDHSLATEIRQQETKLGATVRDRADMRLRVATSAPEKANAKSSSSAAGVASIDDARRKRLKGNSDG